jgi:multiple sugar transport system permease protein
MAIKISRQRRREKIAGYLCISPWLIGFIIFGLGPIIASLILSFCKYPITKSPQWIGLGNYQEMFFGDEIFWLSLKVTSIYALVSVPVGLAIALLLALLLNMKLPGIPVFRTIFYLPAIVSGVALALLWRWIFQPDVGIINRGLRIIGLAPEYLPKWLESPDWALWAIIIMSLWGVGGAMIIFLAGLQGIPKELYESSRIDGAGVWSQFKNVTFPMLSPVIFFNLIMGIIASFQVFTQAYIMTNGGPRNATMFYVLYLYRNAFEYFRMGYASALAWFLFLVIFIMTAIVIKSSPMWVYYEGELKGGRK